RDDDYISHKHRQTLNFGVKATSIYHYIISSPMKRFKMFDDVVLHISERDQFKIFVLATVFTPAGGGAMDIDLGDVTLLFLFNFETYRNLLGNGRFAWAAFCAANHNDLGHW